MLFQSVPEAQKRSSSKTGNFFAHIKKFLRRAFFSKKIIYKSNRLGKTSAVHEMIRKNQSGGKIHAAKNCIYIFLEKLSGNLGSFYRQAGRTPILSLGITTQKNPYYFKMAPKTVICKGFQEGQKHASR